MVFVLPATRSVKSAKPERLEEAKLQPLLTPSVTEVSPAVGFCSERLRPSRIGTATEAEMSDPLTSIQRRLNAVEEFPNWVHRVTQYEIEGMVKVEVVIGAVFELLV